MADIKKVIIFEFKEKAKYLLSTISDMDTDILVEKMSKSDLHEHKGETFWKALIFAKEASEIQPKLEEFKQNFDLESGGEITVIAEGELDESVEYERTIWTESVKRVSTWWPLVLLQWFGKTRDINTVSRPSCFFVFDSDDEKDMSMYKETSEALESLELPCYWPGHAVLTNPGAFEENHDFAKHIVLFSRGDGMKMAEQNWGFIKHFASGPVEKILIFANQPDSKFVQLIGTLPPRTILAYPMMKSLNYRIWVSLLRELDLISCKDVVFEMKIKEKRWSSEDAKSLVRIILFLLFWPLIVVAFLLVLAIWLFALLGGVFVRLDVIYEKIKSCDCECQMKMCECCKNKVDPGYVRKWVYKV